VSRSRNGGVDAGGAGIVRVRRRLHGVEHRNVRHRIDAHLDERWETRWRQAGREIGHGDIPTLDAVGAAGREGARRHEQGEANQYGGKEGNNLEWTTFDLHVVLLEF
jgi:hypothetical protein